MDLGKTAFGVVGVVIAVLIVATLGVPLLDDVSTVPEERSNLGYTDLYSEVDSVEIASASSAVTIDGVAFTPGTGVRTLAMSSDFTLFSSGSTYYWSAMTSDGAATGTLGDTWSFEMSGGNWSFNDGSSTRAGSSDKFFALKADGDKALIPNTGVAYANASSEVYVVLSYLSGSVVETVFGEVESISSGEQDVDVFYADRTSTVSVTATWTAAESDGAWAISSPIIEATSFTVYPSILVDLEYTALVADDGSTRSTLFGVVITLLVIVPVIMAVRLIGGRE